MMFMRQLGRISLNWRDIIGIFEIFNELKGI